LNPIAKFPETTERPEYFVGFEDNVADALKCKILFNDLSTVLHRSVVKFAPDIINRNQRCASDIQETLERLDSRPSATISSDSQPRQRSRKFHDGISNRTRSKAGYIDQNTGNRTRSKVHVV
jgi:hypothetical protein